MSAEVVKLSHTNAIIKFTPNTVGAGATYTVGLSTTGFTGQIVSTGQTVGLALTFVQGVDSFGIGTPRVNIKKATWTTQNGTNSGIRVTRNGVDVLQLFHSGVTDTTAITQNNNNDIVVTIDGSGTLILDLAKVSGYENN
jgi:hypothetical protein